MTTTVKERPILFSAPMIQALMRGAKTQTRRIIKTQPFMVLTQEQWHSRAMSGVDPYGCKPLGSYTPEELIAKCPYGLPGDRLWVRETFNVWRHDAESTWEGPINGARGVHAAQVVYAADNRWAIDWRPSIFMPRWASRITLELTDVRVQRLNEISEEDAIAEGVPFSLMGSTHKIGFENLWNSINGCNAHQANPWVFALTFRRID